MPSGTSMLASDGSSTALMIARLVICPPIHSMVVVTSPIGDQAPPEFAEMTMMPAKNRRSSCSVSYTHLFAADVSHELRTPVAIVRSAAEVLIEYPDLPDAIEQRLRTIYRQAVRMGQILDAMLHLAREDGEEGDPACAIADVIADAVTDCSFSLVGRPTSEKEQ